jgi:hypothetical protein
MTWSWASSSRQARLQYNTLFCYQLVFSFSGNGTDGTPLQELFGFERAFVAAGQVRVMMSQSILESCLQV